MIGVGGRSGYAPSMLVRGIAGLQALLDRVGGSAVLCWDSSGSPIALHAATTGLPVTGLALWEVPIIGTTERARTWATQFMTFRAAEDHTGAIENDTKDMQPDWKAGLKASPIWTTMAYTPR